MSNQCRIDVKSMPNRPLTKGEGEADSRVGSGGAVPNKPLTMLGQSGGVVPAMATRHGFSTCDSAKPSGMPQAPHIIQSNVASTIGNDIVPKLAQEGPNSVAVMIDSFCRS